MRGDGDARGKKNRVQRKKAERNERIEGTSSLSPPPALIIQCRFITILIGAPRHVELAGFGTMRETGTRPLPSTNVIEYFAIVTLSRPRARARTLREHYRLCGENMLSTAVAKCNDGITVQPGVEDVSLVAETFNGPSRRRSSRNGKPRME